MYTDFFGLNEKPFSITPDPRYLYLTRRHADALAHLIYGISESGGFIQLTGEVGTGKTTLIRSLLEQLPKKAKIAVILNPNLEAHEFLRAVCQELHILVPPTQSKSELIAALNNYLLRAHAEGTRVVLIVDEAQTLDSEVLEQVRLLTNLETTRQKLLQIILIGQPELRDVLQRPDMRQIAQRITGRFHLEPLKRDETFAYVKHRMKVAGAHSEVFKPSAVRELFRRSAGIPRLINVVADRALLAAYSLDQTKIDGRLVRRAAAEVFGKSNRRWWSTVGLSSLLIVAVALLLHFSTRPNQAAREGPTEPTQLGMASPRAELSVDGIAADTADVGRDQNANDRAPTIAAIEDLLVNGDIGADIDRAFVALFGLWDIEIDLTVGPPCSQAIDYGLQCLSLSDGSVRQLRQLDRPSVLTLTDQFDRSYYVVLVGLGDDFVELRTFDSPLRVSLPDLSQYWHGEHTLLWKPNTPTQPLLARGMRGEGVQWLRAALSDVFDDGATSSWLDTSVEFDRQLEELVRAYQRDNRLKVDGIVGARTQISLATDLGSPGIPTLSRSY